MISTIPASLPSHTPSSNPCRVWSQAAGKVQCLFRGDKVRMHGSMQAACRAVTHLLEIVVCLVVRWFLLPSAFPAKVYGSFCGLCMVLGSCPHAEAWGRSLQVGGPSPTDGMERCQHRAGSSAFGCFGAPDVAPPFALPKKLGGFGSC